MSEYTKRLNFLKDLPDHELKEIKDQWRTGDDLYYGLEEVLRLLTGDDARFVWDLFTDGQNSKTDWYYTADDNALKQNWAEDLRFVGRPCDYMFGNPPYSIGEKDDEGDVLTGMREVMAKAIEQRDEGARLGLLIKSATSESWWPDLAPDRTVFIKGRVSFEKPVWFRDPQGTPPKKLPAFFGCAFLLFDKTLSTHKTPIYISKAEVLSLGAERCAEMAEYRKRHIEKFEL